MRSSPSSEYRTTRRIPSSSDRSASDSGYSSSSRKHSTRTARSHNANATFDRMTSAMSEVATSSSSSNEIGKSLGVERVSITRKTVRPKRTMEGEPFSLAEEEREERRRKRSHVSSRGGAGATVGSIGEEFSLLSARSPARTNDGRGYRRGPGVEEELDRIAEMDESGAFLQIRKEVSPGSGKSRTVITDTRIPIGVESEVRHGMNVPPWFTQNSRKPVDEDIKYSPLRKSLSPTPAWLAHHLSGSYKPPHPINPVSHQTSRLYSESKSNVDQFSTGSLPSTSHLYFGHTSSSPSTSAPTPFSTNGRSLPRIPSSHDYPPVPFYEAQLSHPDLQLIPERSYSHPNTGNYLPSNSSPLFAVSQHDKLSPPGNRRLDSENYGTRGPSRVEILEEHPTNHQHYYYPPSEGTAIYQTSDGRYSPENLPSKTLAFEFDLAFGLQHSSEAQYHSQATGSHVSPSHEFQRMPSPVEVFSDFWKSKPVHDKRAPIIHPPASQPPDLYANSLLRGAMTYDFSLPLLPPPTSPLHFYGHTRENQSEQRFSSYFSAPSGKLQKVRSPRSSQGSPFARVEADQALIQIPETWKDQAQPVLSLAPSDSPNVNPIRDFSHSFSPQDHELPDRFHFARIDSSPSPESSFAIFNQSLPGGVPNYSLEEEIDELIVGDENFLPFAANDVWTDQNTFPEVSLPKDTHSIPLNEPVDTLALLIPRSRSAPPSTTLPPDPQLPVAYANPRSPSPQYSTSNPIPVYEEDEIYDEEAADSITSADRQSGLKESLVRTQAVGPQQSLGVRRHEGKIREAVHEDNTGVIGGESITGFREVIEETYAEEEEATDQAFTFWEDEEDDPIEAC